MSRKKPKDLRSQRRRSHGCWDHLIIAPLWVAYEANLGTLMRTCDAVGACIAVPGTQHYKDALSKGDTLHRRPHIHWVKSKLDWIEHEKAKSTNIVAVETAEGAASLMWLEPATERTIILLGHERNGVPPEAVDLADQVIEIPMIGQGSSLNVAVAGSIVLYRLAGLA